ncbi:MAG: hypothetical protein ACD_17C00405G0001 [uncultured bacterium]|nr:MAG: hypothetical protein ACD_17C00405G0001 [uncultured bacterium]
MVDLGRPVRCGESDIMDSVVNIFVQSDLGDEFYKHFAKNAFPPGGFYNTGYDGKRYYPPEVLEKTSQERRVVHLRCYRDEEIKNQEYLVFFSQP